MALVVGFLIALVRHGPLKAGDITYRVVVNGVAELFRTSPRRVWALARLAVKESIRRRVVVALVVYVVILLFAGWFLQDRLPRAGQAVFQRRAHGDDVPRAADRAVGQRVQPAARFQVEDDLHGGHQAGPRGRHRARPHPRLHDRRHGAAGDHGRCSAPSLSGECWTIRTRSTSPTWKTIYDADGKPIGKKGRTTLEPVAPARRRDLSRRHRPCPFDQRA